jgi:hypothetical protein
VSLRCIVGLHAWTVSTYHAATQATRLYCVRCHRTRLTHPR